MEQEVGRDWSSSLKWQVAVLLLPISVPCISLQSPAAGPKLYWYTFCRVCSLWEAWPPSMCLIFSLWYCFFQPRSASAFTSIWPFLSVCLSLSIASESQPLCELSNLGCGGEGGCCSVHSPLTKVQDSVCSYTVMRLLSTPSSIATTVAE